MVAVGMMQVAGDPIIYVITVRDRLMAAAGTVLMTRLMTAAAMVRSAAIGVFGRHLDHVLIDMVFMRVVEVTVMQVVGMAEVLNAGVAAARSVLVSVVGMGGGGTGGHGVGSFTCKDRRIRVGRPSASRPIPPRLFTRRRRRDRCPHGNGPLLK
jgi:hypothetical protein